MLAAEAIARSELLPALELVPWRGMGLSSKVIYKADAQVPVGRYLIALMSAFADAAGAAVRAGRFPAAALDAVIEAFYVLAVKQVYWGLRHEKVQKAWNHFPDQELHAIVFAASWHARYLAEVPEILIAIRSPQPDLTETQVNAKSGRRRMVLEPLLKSLGLSVPQWATKAGVNQAVAYDYLNGKSDPRPDSRRALAGALDLDPDDLPK